MLDLRASTVVKNLFPLQISLQVTCRALVHVERALQRVVATSRLVPSVQVTFIFLSSLVRVLFLRFVEIGLRSCWEVVSASHRVLLRRQLGYV